MRALNWVSLCLLLLGSACAHKSSSVDTVSRVPSGTSDIGGGAGMICRNVEGKVITAEVLDLFEAQVFPPKRLIPSQDIPYPQQFEAAAARLRFTEVWRTSFDRRLENLRRGLEQRIEYMPVGTKLLAPTDLGLKRPIPVRENCAIETIGYRADGKLILVPDVFHALNETHKAAFFMHEALYVMKTEEDPFELAMPSLRKEKLDRYNEGTELVRKLNALLFASDSKLSDLSSAVSGFMRIKIGEQVSQSFLYVDDSVRGRPLIFRELSSTDLSDYRETIRLDGGEGERPPRERNELDELPLFGSRLTIRDTKKFGFGFSRELKAKKDETRPSILAKKQGYIYGLKLDLKAGEYRQGFVYVKDLEGKILIGRDKLTEIHESSTFAIAFLKDDLRYVEWSKAAEYAWP